MPLFDYACPNEHTFERHAGPDASTVTCDCGAKAERIWIGRQHATAFDKNETTVVWKNPQTGKIEYPGRNDVPIPPRLAAMGFERHELRSLKQVEHFEKTNGVRNERAWFDKGSGGSFDRDGRL